MHDGWASAGIPVTIAPAPVRRPASLRRTMGRQARAAGRELMDENDHPKGALLFMLIYLFLLAALWTNAYVKLWRG